MVGTMNWSEELQNRGPNDIYELSALTHDCADSLEFLVHQCQIKDNIIQHLSRTLRNELGEGWWRQYTQAVYDSKVDHLARLTGVSQDHPDFFPRVQTLMEEKPLDIPL